MADARKQMENVMALVGEGSIRRIHLAVLAALVLSGIVLHGLASWYILHAVGEYWAAAPIQVWPFTVGVWILILALGSAALWRRLRGMSERGSGEVEAAST